jgi:hypothetical protein
MLVSIEKFIQEELKRAGHYSGKIDGDRGPKTNKAATAALKASSDPELPSDWQNWSSKRRAIAVLQLAAKAEGIETGSIDGWWGPQTEFAYDSLRTKRETGNLPRNWRDIEPSNENPNNWPRQNDVPDFYGPHGIRGGRSPEMVRVRCPWQLKIAWNLNQTTSKISIHKKCAQSLERVLTNVHETYGDKALSDLRLDHYGGSYAPRKMRGGSRWSMHSWAIAIDWDPARNKLKANHEEASMSASEYDDWWAAWEAEGWLSLGRMRNFDWMHVQAAKL